MKNPLFIFSVFMLFASVVGTAMPAAVRSADDDPSPTVSESVGNALGKAKDVIGEGVEKTKEALETGAQKTKKALIATTDYSKELAGKFANKTLQQIGFSTDEMGDAFDCARPIIDLLEKVSRHPHDRDTYEELKKSRCRGVIKEFSYKCIHPKILIATAIPGIGVAISSACQTIQRLKERLDDALKEDVAIYEKESNQELSCPKEHAGAPGS